MSILFRKEAVNAQSYRLAGAVSLAQPLSLTLTTTILVLVVVATLAFLFSADYARKETVAGFLIPDKGMIKSFSNGNGTVQEVFVQEGDTVAVGAPLVSIVRPRSTDSGEELSDKLIAELMKQLDLLNEEIAQHAVLEAQELRRIVQRAQAVSSTRQVVLHQKDLASEKMALLKQQQVQFAEIYENGYMSVLDYQQREEHFLTAKQESVSLDRTLLQQADELQQLAYDENNISEQYQIKSRDIERQKSDLRNQLSEIRNGYQYVVRANVAGTVTAIQIVAGDPVTTGRPLLKTMPAGAQLVAELLLPTRSAGFVQRGDIVRLRFAAFPHQRFGFVESKITRIDNALLTQGETDLPIFLSEPVYRLQSELGQQFVQGYGKEFPLKSGMLFEADIVLDRRSLVEWLFDPVYSLSGRLN